MLARFLDSKPVGIVFIGLVAAVGSSPLGVTDWRPLVALPLLAMSTYWLIIEEPGAGGK
jgi:hypothetical protein